MKERKKHGVSTEVTKRYRISLNTWPGVISKLAFDGVGVEDGALTQELIGNIVRVKIKNSKNFERRTTS